MDALLSPASLARNVEALSARKFLRDPVEVISSAVDLLQPPERISTVDCAEKRKIPGAEDGAVVKYDRWRTPYNVGPMNSLDNPRCRLMVMVKPSRSGGTTVAENYLFKMGMHGPMGHVAWVLNSDEAVGAYCKTVVAPMFDPELNPKLAVHVGKGRGDNTDAFKRVRTYPVEWLSAKDSTFRNREPVFMVMDETDAWPKRYAATPKVQMDGRQKRLGNRKKGAIMSHPDLGWNSGVAAAFEDTSRGIFIMKCPECLGFASAYSTKYWPTVPQFKLTWDCNEYADDPANPGRRIVVRKREDVGKDRRLELASETASMLCPHCGVALTDQQRREMIDAALREATNALAGWMHRGQTLDPVEGVMGEMDDHPAHGFWVHGLMLKTETLAALARAYEAAKTKFERTKVVEELREFMSKQLGEVFEGVASIGGVSAKGLKERVKESASLRGTAPAAVRFITAAVDPGGRKYDVAWFGWDLEGRSWLIDRVTIRQRLHGDGVLRDIHPGLQIEDWMLLLDKVVDRKFPIQGRPGFALPVAVTCIDSGDGNITWKAREFARRAINAGYAWDKWSKVKLIKGEGGKKPALPDVPRKIDKDELGKAVEPVIFEYSLGADALKEQTYERLGVTDGGPGQVTFHVELEDNYVEEYFGEALIDGKWVRSGPNENLDLHGYAEAGRQMLKADRADIKWTEGKLPIWATPIAIDLEGGDHAAPAGKPRPKESLKSKFARLEALNRTGE